MNLSKLLTSQQAKAALTVLVYAESLIENEAVNETYDEIVDNGKAISEFIKSIPDTVTQDEAIDALVILITPVVEATKNKVDDRLLSLFNRLRK